MQLSNQRLVRLAATDPLTGTNPTMSQKSGARFRSRGTTSLSSIPIRTCSDSRPPRPTFSAISVSARLRSTRWSLPSNETAASDVNPASPEASKSSCRRQACRSSNGSVSKRQNHWLGEAREVFRGEPTDVQAAPFVLRDSEGTIHATGVMRTTSAALEH